MTYFATKQAGKMRVIRQRSPVSRKTAIQKGGAVILL